MGAFLIVPKQKRLGLRSPRRFSAGLRRDSLAYGELVDVIEVVRIGFS